MPDGAVIRAIEGIVGAMQGSASCELSVNPRSSRGFGEWRGTGYCSPLHQIRMTAAQCAGKTNMKNLNFLTHQEIFDRAVEHLFGQGRTALLPRGGGAYRGYCGGCPVGSFIHPRDYMTAMEGIPVRYIGKAPSDVPMYMDVGVAALKKALLRSRLNIYDPATIELLSCLQNVHDVFGAWEWRDRLRSIARQFKLSDERTRTAA